MASLGVRQQKIVYLITYSRVDFTKTASKDKFAEAVVESWEKCGIKLAFWVVAMEKHANAGSSCESSEASDYHFHMAIKLQRRGRWLMVRNILDDVHGLKVNFSSNHNTYYSAYKYVTKEDPEPLFSDGHPDISNDAPRTEKAIASRCKKENGGKKGKRLRKRGERLSVFDVTQIVQKRSIQSRLELVALAVSQSREGNTALANFVANRGHKCVQEALSLAKEFAESEERLARSKKTRIQILIEFQGANCVPDCEGRWYTAAVTLMEHHGIMISAFATAIYTVLEKGRAKYQNIYIHGPANTGKTFILSPLKVIYNAFCNPATGSFAWIGVDEVEIIFLNDFRWDPKIIAWADFLQALEGDIVHLPAPKNVCPRDIELNADIPFFATADAPIVQVRGGSIDRANTDMMNVRWHFFHFWKQIPRSEQLRLIPCGHCFAKFVLDNKL